MIGIDIGSNFVKVCRIESVNKKGLFVYFVLQDVSKMSVKQKQIVIMNLVNKIKTKKEHAVLAIGGGDIVIKELVLSKLKTSSKSFKNFVLEKAKDSFNENLSYYYTSCDVVREKSDKDCCVMFSAVKKHKVMDTVSLLDRCSNVQVSCVTMEALALANSFIEFGPEYKVSENVVLLNIGRDVTNIVVLHNKEVVFVKDIDFGGQNITDGIAKIYEIPEKLAEELKKRNDLREKINFNMLSILRKTASPLIDVLFRTMEYCVTRQFIPIVDRIVITGGGALTNGLDIFINETLGISTEKWNPVMNNDFVGYTDKNYGLFIPVALGLAIK